MLCLIKDCEWRSGNMCPWPGEWCPHHVERDAREARRQQGIREQKARRRRKAERERRGDATDETAGFEAG